MKILPTIIWENNKYIVILQCIRIPTHQIINNMKIKATFFTLLVLILGLNLTGCRATANKIMQWGEDAESWMTLEPSKTLISKDFKFGKFAKVEISNGFHVEYIVDSSGTSDKLTVHIEMPSNYAEYIRVNENDDKLEIKTHGLDKIRKDLDYKIIKVTLKAPALHEIDLSGASIMNVSNSYILDDDLEIDISGASKLTVADLKCKSLDIDVSGASEVHLSEVISSSATYLECSGASNLKIREGKFDTLKAHASGASSINADNVNANMIDMEASGASSVGMSGQAQQIKKSSSGASSVNFDER